MHPHIICADTFLLVKNLGIHATTIRCSTNKKIRNIEPPITLPEELKDLVFDDMKLHTQT